MIKSKKLFRNVVFAYHNQVKSLAVKVQKKEKKYSHTIQLPKTQFPHWMSASKRAELDDFILKNCGFEELYSWQRNNLRDPEFVLHDGPPYANGIPHMGHAINKILKDIINRSKILGGIRVNYKPGWDCHGLPIELKALGGRFDLGPIEIRNRARKFAIQAIIDQRVVFKTWGLMADWKEECYYTFDNEYVKNQIQQFYNLLQKELIFRDMKPVYWSPSSRTALAEAELEYKHDHESEAVTVRLEVVEGAIKSDPSPLYLLVWTTTPWSFPANEAVAFNPSLDYSMIELNGGKYVICSKLLPTLQSKVTAKIKEIKTFKGVSLEGCKYRHPLRDEIKPVLPAGYVTDEVGTGLVHTAPSHGPDDYVLALKHNIPILSYVDEFGNYTQDAGKTLEALPAMSDGMEKVLKLLKEDIIAKEKIKHSYPYDWRTKKPVMLRASKQWFIDTKALKNRAIDVLQSVKILPERNTSTLLSQIESRPYWCISRQRAWGVPIPVFYDDKDNVIVSDELLNHYCSLIDEKGTDFWWSCSTSDLIPQNICQKFGLREDQIKKGQDILDIWFDSGISWSTVLDGKVADLYLEGIDQFTGWFQSSLLTSVALADRAPYKALLTHGFAVDDKGRKMSKSLGNVVNPQDITQGSIGNKSQALGVDVLRWWVAGHSLQHTNIPVSKSTLEDSIKSLKKIRNVLKFLLGSIHDFPLDAKPPLFLIDQYILLKVQELNTKITEMYNAYEFNKICLLILNFFTNELSSFYCTVTKDRLYCDDPNGDRRRAVQFTMNEILHGVLKSISPILPVLSEEVFLHHPHNAEKLHYFHGNWKQHASEIVSNEQCIMSAIETALKVKDEVMKEKPVNAEGTKCTCTIEAGEEIWQHLKMLQNVETSIDSELVELFQFSQVSLIKSEGKTGFTVTISVSKRHLCDRCKKYNSLELGSPCQRCLNVLNLLN